MSDLLRLLTGEGMPTTPKTGQGRLVLGLSGTDQGDDSEDGEQTWVCQTCKRAQVADEYYWRPRACGGLRRCLRCKRCHIEQSEAAAKKKRERTKA